MSKETQKCGRCSREKTLKEFGIRPDGKVYKLCPPCRALSIADNKRARSGAPGKKIHKLPDNYQSASLDLFLKIPRSSGKIGWLPAQAEILASQVAIAVEAGVSPDYKRIALKVGKPASSCINLVKELRQAANDPDGKFKGKTLNIREYFEAGRPYSLNAKNKEPIKTKKRQS